MTKDKQRIAIAEACGWLSIAKKDEDGKIFGHYPLFLEPKIYGEEHRTLVGVYEIPDYLNDLNAMHEAEKEIIARNKMNGFDGYENTLCGIIDNGNCVHATASQKAEAFLRTLDLWVNS